MSDFELVRLTFDELEASPGFADWLAAERLSIALSKGNSLCLIGLGPDGSVSLVEYPFGTCRGLCAVDSETLFLATRYQVWRLQNALPEGELSDSGHDRLYLPQTAWTTGTLIVRDLAVDGEGQVVFVNGLFSCLSAPSTRLSFEPVWMPPFISALVAEDRCHLSGLAFASSGPAVAGRGSALAGRGPAVATSASRADHANGWTEQQRDGGVVISVPTGETIATGFSMPCSPVLRDGSLWLCAGGSGELVVIEPRDGDAAAVTALPGFARGLALSDEHAVVGTSCPSRGETFAGLPLSDRLRGADAGGRCGVFVVDLESGAIEHSLLLTGGSSEIHGVALLAGVRNASAVPFTGAEVQELVTVPR
jgi:uncharacterized protein (TIGR03032 family)